MKRFPGILLAFILTLATALSFTPAYDRTAAGTGVKPGYIQSEARRIDRGYCSLSNNALWVETRWLVKGGDFLAALVPIPLPGSIATH